jgi:hypothetical protein
MNNAKPAVQWLFLDLNAFFASCEQQEAPALAAALIEELTAHCTAALQAMLADNPKVALVATVHALAFDSLYETMFTSPGQGQRLDHLSARQCQGH